MKRVRTIGLIKEIMKKILFLQIFSSDSLIDSAKISIDNPDFDLFAKEAYAAEDGYAIRFNSNGHKEMFIAGTRNTGDWFNNAKDSLIQDVYKRSYEHVDLGFLDRDRRRKSEMYERLVRNHDVDIVYGHSRGGAIVADMDVPQHVQKIGLDAAMVIAYNKDMVNFKQGGVKGTFDTVIGSTGRHNIKYDKDSRFHQSWQHY